MQVEQVKKRSGEGAQGESRVPLYRQISDTLLAGIREGKFPVGTFLPGELELEFAGQKGSDGKLPLTDTSE